MVQLRGMAIPSMAATTTPRMPDTGTSTEAVAS
jgi:hypothetical protein